MRSVILALTVLTQACGDMPAVTEVAQAPSLNACREIEQLPFTLGTIVLRTNDNRTYIFTRNATWKNDVLVQDEVVNFTPYCTVTVNDGTVASVAY